MKKLFVFIFLASFLSAFSQEKVTEKDIYEVVNFVIKNRKERLQEKGFKIKFLMRSKSDSAVYHYLNKIEENFYSIEENPNDFFTNNDIEFINKQIGDNLNFNFQQKLINQLKILSVEEYKKLGTGKEFWKNYDTKYGKKSFVEMMVPLFSLDKKTVIIEYSNITGSRGGFGEIVILKKENNTWKYLKNLSAWKF
ncbi:hypothetical protein GCM10010992_01110 [Cloacibacterium rupense]|uniref:DUF3828 domain-containing protein n=1 Tax=Cloacibacterium rupense TaxID=517423 RepID=A0ABQ2NF36_9FLAO|nr:hypothetical protein [Cloacibacterium rupense]GGP01265.1 hypothetical protein GCM10010992_01110 [Cloacibacterium rupense]